MEKSIALILLPDHPKRVILRKEMDIMITEINKIKEGEKKKLLSLQTIRKNGKNNKKHI